VRSTDEGLGSLSTGLLCFLEIKAVSFSNHEMLFITCVNKSSQAFMLIDASRNCCSLIIASILRVNKFVSREC